MRALGLRFEGGARTGPRRIDWKQCYQPTDTPQTDARVNLPTAG